MTRDDARDAAPALPQLAAIIARGGVVAIPTDTVHGLAADPRSRGAVERIYRIKRRPADLELTVLGADVRDLQGLVEMTPVAAELASRFWPGPLSIVVPARPAGLAVPRHGATLSVRIPAHPRLLDLLRRTGPLATTSANRHGDPPATSAAEVRARLGDEVDAILDGVPGAGRPSTIIDCAAHPPRLLRAGPIGLEELTPYLGGAHP